MLDWLDFMRTPASGVAFWRAIGAALLLSVFAPPSIFFLVGSIVVFHAAPWAAERTASYREEAMVLLVCLIASLGLLVMGLNVVFGRLV